MLQWTLWWICLFHRKKTERKKSKIWIVFVNGENKNVCLLILSPLLFFFGNLKDTEYKELKGRHSYFHHWQTLFIFCFFFSQFSSYEYMFKEITLLYDYSVFFYFYFILFINFILFIIFGCIGSSLLWAGFL